MTFLKSSLLLDHHRARPLLNEDALGMVEYVSQGLHDAAKEAAVLLYFTWNRYFPGGYDQKCRSGFLLR